MNKISIKNNTAKTNTGLRSGRFSELKFWRDIALQQQKLLHEKHRT